MKERSSVLLAIEDVSSYAVDHWQQLLHQQHYLDFRPRVRRK